MSFVLNRIFRLHRMHEIQTIVTDVRGVCQSVCHATQLGFTVRGSSGAAFAKLLWPLVVCIYLDNKICTQFLLISETCKIVICDV